MDRHPLPGPAGQHARNSQTRPIQTPKRTVPPQIVEPGLRHQSPSDNPKLPIPTLNRLVPSQAVSTDNKRAPGSPLSFPAYQAPPLPPNSHLRKQQVSRELLDLSF